MITGALETLGTALVAMRRAPDPRVDLEVALVKMTSPAATGGIDPSVVEALIRRVEHLEKALADSGTTRTPSAPQPPQPPSSSGTGPAAAARATLAGSAVKPPPPPPTPKQGLEPTEVPAAPESSSEPEPARSGDLPGRDELSQAWSDDLVASLSKRARARFSAARFVDVRDGSAVIALPNEPHRRRCSELVGEVESAIAARFGVAVPLVLVVDETGSPPAKAPTSTGPVSGGSTDVVDEAVDLNELVDADASEGSAVERVAKAFPGATLVDPT